MESSNHRRLVALIEVIEPFELPAGVIREKGARLTVALKDAKAYGPKVRILKTNAPAA